MSTHDLRLLFNAIIAKPEEDTPRLLYADELDDLHAANPRWIGETLDTERRDRAELIRCQIEFRQLDPYHFSCTGTKCGLKRCNELRLRSRELLAANPSWRPECPQCEGEGTVPYSSMPGSRCYHCRGSGRVGDVVRGFLCSVPVPSISSVLVRDWEDETSDGEGRVWFWKPTPWAVQLFREHPVLRIVAKDRVPYPTHSRNEWSFYDFEYFSVTDLYPDAGVPPCVFRVLVQDARCRHDRYAGLAFFPTADAANDTLATALCDVVRGKL